MGRLLRIEAENFKSYAGTQIIGPFKDFTAVIGPNGAGKSNLMDAISFVLGVQSKHLRSTKLSDLVFRADGAVPSSRRAMVKVVYMIGEGEEVDGQEAGEEVHFSRVISAGGASSYRLNGKEVTWESYEKRLRSIGVLVKARNFLVFQGDVESIASKSPKELTQLFEQISGSDESKAEYEELKTAKEKAEEDTIFSFKRKKGCQAERKQVKEQKEEAERFQQKLKEMEDLKIESFLVQLFHINKDVDEREGDIKLMKEELEEAQEREKEADVVLKAKKKELSRLNRELSKAQAELNRQKRLRDDMGPQHIKLKESISTLKRQVADGDKAGEKVARDREAQRGTVAALSRDIAAVKQREEAASSGSKSKGKKGGGGGGSSGSSSGGLAQLSEAKAAEYEKLKADARARGSGQREEMADIERQLASASSKLDQLRSEQASLDERLAGFDSSAKRFRQRQGDMEKTTLKAKKDREELQRELDDLTGRSKGDALRATEIEDALRSINEQLRDAKDGRRMTKHQEKMAECLETLKRMFPGVRGRLVDLCKPTQRKYNVAVTTAAGKFMDGIVVDTKAECLECLSYMQTNKIGTAQFIPLDAIKVKPIDESLRSLGSEHRLCADIMQGGDEGVRRAILFAVGNTVVSDTLDAARVLCSGQDGKKIKAVTLKGFLISKSGNMTGGTTTRDLDRAGQWDEKEFADLKQRRQELESERDTLSREHRNRSLKTELETKIRGLQSREKHSSADLDITREELKSITKHRQTAEADRTKVTAELGEREAEVDKLEGTLLTLQKEVDAVENEVFAPFLKSVGASDIRSFEEGQLKDMQEQYKARMKLQQHRSNLEAQLAHERSRDFDGPLEKVTCKTEAKRKELEDQQLKMQELIDSEKSIMEAEDEASKEHLAAKEVARGHEAEVKAAHAGRQKLVKERDGISKRISSEESTLEQLRAKLHGVLQEAKVEQVALPLVGGGTLAGGGGGGDKTRGRKRGRGDGEDGDEEEEEEEESEESSSLDGARSSGASGLSLSASGTQDSSTVHFSQAQNRSVQEDRAEALEVDLSKLKRHRGAKDAAALESLVSSYRKQMLELQAQINQMTPNMRAVERFGDVSDRLKASGQTFEQSKQNAAGAVLKFNEAKQRRYDAFMQAYAHVSENLNTIYKDLTRSSKHPLGGNAFLSLDNPEEPYLGGVKFNAMPPMKRFRDMDQLSGGEKTVAALGLLFAIHSFRPAPFFVMDEIDAALDNINVKKVCNYIQGRSGDFQSIVISLKDMFYEKADALVGICRDHATNSSRTLTLDLEAIGEA